MTETNVDNDGTRWASRGLVHMLIHDYKYNRQLNRGRLKR
jgi:hypothetical protein